MSSKPGRLSVGVIGAGRVGAVLGSALRAVGHEVVGASGGSPATRERVDALLPGVTLLDPLEVARRADLVLVCVPDDAVAAVVAWVAEQGGFRGGQLVAHTSGSHGVDVLRPAVLAGAIPLAIHPAMTFTGTSLDLARLVGTPFAVTAPVPVQPIAQALVVELGGEPVLVPDSARAGYHTALSHAANHLVTLLVQAQEILRASGVAGEASLTDPEDDGVARLLGPLTRTALERALGVGPAALTGPVSRGDLGTVAMHLSVLDELESGAGTAATYRVLATETARLAERSGRLSPETSADLLRLLRANAGPGGPSRAGASGEDPVRPAVVHTLEDLRARRRRLPGSVALVPTMGALHAGHLALVRAARAVADHVVVSIFVNPTQFGDPADLAAYPRTLPEDVAALAALGADAPDLVLAPSVHEMYPVGTTQVGIEPGPLAQVLEGASRPGHFAGVLTVVAKLLHLVQPDVAVFGEKDAQQLALVRAMVRDLDIPTWILSVPVVREADGLALSSRNARLSPQGRVTALALSRSAAAAVRLTQAGADPAQALRAARVELDAELDAEPDAEPRLLLDYALILDPATFEPVSEPRVDARELRYVVAAVVEGVRLIDTAPLPAPTLPVSSGSDRDDHRAG